MVGMGALSALGVGGLFCAPWFTTLGRPRRLLNEILPSIRRTAAPGFSRGGSASPSTSKGVPKDLTCVGGPLGLVAAILRLNLKGARLDIGECSEQPLFCFVGTESHNQTNRSVTAAIGLTTYPLAYPVIFILYTHSKAASL